MSDTTDHLADVTPTHPGHEQPNPWPRDNEWKAQALAQPKPAEAPKPPPVVKEPTINERAAGLLAQVTDSHRHNAPITPWMLTELAAVVGHVTGNKTVAVPHAILDGRGLNDQVVFRKADGTVMLISSAEEALAYVRSLPADVQKRPHWVVVDKELVDAIATVQGSDVSPAIRQFKWAVSEDERLNPRAAPKIAAKPDAPKVPAA